MSTQTQPRSPTSALLLVFFGTWVFTQVALGDAIGRLLTYADPDTDDTPPARRGSMHSPRRMTASRETFVRLLLSQKGDTYVFGGETHGERNPNGYDCSEFIQWAMNRLGYDNFPDGSGAQIEHCKSISVKRAMRTRGAVLHHEGHIAVSLGNNKVIEAQNSKNGVGVFSAVGRGWTRGGLIPELERKLVGVGTGVML